MDPAISLTLKFVVVGMVWILFSDSLLFAISPDSMLWKLSHLHILKGILFIGVVGGFLFCLVHDFNRVIALREKDGHSLFSGNPVAMGLLDVDTLRFINVNEAAVTLYGYEPQEWKHKLLFDLLIEDQQKRLKEAVASCSGDSKKLGVFSLNKKDGSIAVVEITMVCVQRNGQRVFLITTHDISRQVLAENEIKQLRQFIDDQVSHRTNQLERQNTELTFRTRHIDQVNAELIFINEKLQSANKKLLWEIDQLKHSREQVHNILTGCESVAWSIREKEITYLSESASLLYEAPASLLRAPWFWLTFIHPDDKPVVEARYAGLTETGSCAHVYRVITPSGKTRWIGEKIKASKDKSGAVIIWGSCMEIPQQQAAHLRSTQSLNSRSSEVEH